jgi:hypothetical protein
MNHILFPSAHRAALVRLGAAMLLTQALCAIALSAEAPTTMGPLRVLKSNPRYLTDGSGQVIFLTGSHTWNNLQDMGRGDPPPAFDFDAYLDFLQRYQHNFIRLWCWELLAWDLRPSADFTDQSGVLLVTPHPWPRNGPGTALDGKLKFDLAKFDEAYFRRLRSRVQAAANRGIYVSVMLFEGWALQHIDDGASFHPLHRHNNINGIDGDPNGDGHATELHTLNNPAITRLQQAYVRKVIETVGDQDNVLFEIANESGTYSTEWQYQMIRFVKDCEKNRPKQHPVGMTFQYSRDQSHRGTNRLLLESPADWISPNPDADDGYNYRTNPPPSDGTKVILSDTDHLWGIGGNVDWVWKSFLRGLNPIFMDPYDNRVLGKVRPEQLDSLRVSLGQTRRFAERMDLSRMTPSLDIASTRFCLANAGREYLVYQPDAQQQFTVDLQDAPAEFAVEWFDVQTGETRAIETVTGGALRVFKSPTSAPSVLYLKSNAAN